MSRDFVNEEPITCEWTILDLMARRWGDSSSRTLYRWKGRPPYVEVWWEGGDHGRGAPTIEHFSVDPRVVNHLLSVGYLRGTPKWGYTEMHELELTDDGEKALYQRRRELADADQHGSDFPSATRWFEEFRRARASTTARG